MPVDVTPYFRRSTTPQYREFADACKSHGGEILENGGCFIGKDKASVVIRDWRDDSIDKPAHELKSIFARNDAFFLCYAANSSMECPYNQNRLSGDAVVEEAIEHWEKEIKDDLVFPHDLYDKMDWRISVSNYGRTVAARKKKCDREKEARLSKLATDVVIGKKTVAEAIMEEKI